MRAEPFSHATSDGSQLWVHRWRPDDDRLRSAVLVSHGMGEHAGRYAGVAERLTAAGCEVWAPDQRGHGRTAASPDDLGHLADRDGWNRMVRDLHELCGRLAGEVPAAPRILLGHSMGSLLASQYLLDHADSIAAAVLSGTSGPAGARRYAGLALAHLERVRLGGRGRSRLLDALLFGSFNRAFAPARTAFDWLSRDADEVDRYVADPLCGFVLRARGFCDMLAALGRLERAAELARIPVDLPLLVLAGSDDPVGGRLDGVRRRVRDLERAGLRRVSSRFYPGARHELFHETNRAQVLDDLLAWLEEV